MSSHPPSQRSDAGPRIAPLDPPYDPFTADLLRKLMGGEGEPLKLFRTAARHPDLLRQMASTGAFVFRKDGLSALHREIVIQRTTARCGAEYEWGVHAAIFGERVGLTGERLRDTVNGDHTSQCWSTEEALLVEFVDELHDRSTITDDLWERMTQHWTSAQMLELAMLVGLYHAGSFVINVARVERESYAPTFPPRQVT